MPELPELETVRRGLAATLGFAYGNKLGSDLSKLPQLRTWHFARETLRYPLPIAKLQALVGARLLGLERRSKYLLLYFGRELPGGVLPDMLDIGNWGPKLQLCCVTVHLGMTGVLQILAKLPKQLAKHDHLWLCLQAQNQAHYLLYNDVRRFGHWGYLEFSQLATSFTALGPEPIPLYHQQAPITWALHTKHSPQNDGDNAVSLSEQLYRSSRGVQRELKPCLLDGKAVCGVGNIYASESLWLASLSPRKAAGKMNRWQAASLAQAIQQTIAAAIAAGGTTFNNFRSAAGKSGNFEPRAYGREGQDCLRCSLPIVRLVQAQRATYYCPQCQK